MSRRGLATALGVIAAVSAAAICAYLALAPLVPKRVVTVAGGAETVSVSSASLLEAAGWPVVAPLAVLLAVCVAPLFWRSRAAFLVSAAAVAVFALITWTTVGPYLLPLPVLLLAAGMVSSRAPAP